MSSRADISVLPTKIFPIFSEWLSKYPAVPLAVVVMIGFPFLDQLTAIAWKYMGTSSISSSALISLWAMFTFLHSVSRIGRLNCSIRWCGLALGLVLIVAASGNDVWSSLRLRELRKLLTAQGALRASSANRECTVSA